MPKKNINDLDDKCLEHVFDRLPISSLFNLSKVGITRWNRIRTTVLQKKQTLIVFDSREDVHEYDHYFSFNYNFLKIPPPADPLVRYRKIFHSILADRSLPKNSRPTFCIINQLDLLYLFPNLRKLVLFRVKNISIKILRSVLSRMVNLKYLALIDLNCRATRIPYVVGEGQQAFMVKYDQDIGGKINWQSIWPIIDSLSQLRHLVLWGFYVPTQLDISPRLVSQLHQFVIGNFQDSNNSLFKIFKRFGPFFRQLTLVNVDNADETFRWLSGNSSQAVRLKAQITELTIERALFNAFNLDFMNFVCSSFSSLTYLNFSLQDGIDFISVLQMLAKLTNLIELRLGCFLYFLPEQGLPKLPSIRILTLKMIFVLKVFAKFKYIFPNVEEIGIEKSRISCGCRGSPAQIIDVNNLECELCLRLLKEALKGFKHLPKIE